MNLRWAAAGLLALVLGCGCGSSGSGASTADVSVKHDVMRGVEEIWSTHDRKRLHAQLGRIIASLRGERGSTSVVERARRLALVGFELTQKGVRSQIDFAENDSGEVAAAARDAMRADRYLKRGAHRIRMAGLLLGARIRELDGH